MEKCNFCEREFKNKGGLSTHSPYCNNNPKKIKRAVSKLAGAKKGIIPWNKGLETKDETRNKISSSLIGKSKGIASDPIKEKNRKMKISESMKKNPKSGGLRIGSGRGIKGWYYSNIAGWVYLRSSYEFAYAKWLDKENINWRINKKYFIYSWKNKERKYYPDFFIVDSGIYVETKGFKTEIDEAKWKSLDNLKVLYKKDLIDLGIQL